MSKTIGLKATPINGLVEISIPVAFGLDPSAELGNVLEKLRRQNRRIIGDECLYTLRDNCLMNDCDQLFEPFRLAMFEVIKHHFPLAQYSMMPDFAVEYEEPMRLEIICLNV